MLVEQPPAPARFGPRPIGAGLGQHLDPIARHIDGHQTEADQPAKMVHTSVSVPAAAAGRHRQPHLVGQAHAIDRLEQQFQGEAKLHLHDCELQRLAVSDGDDIAAIDLPFDAEARRFKEALDGRIERSLGHTVQPVTRARAATTVPARTGA
jgi:hypothetical protein